MPVNKSYSISADDFENLLLWLDTDREAAGEKYETIRTRLVKIFLIRKCSAPEELADETIDRVIKKIRNLSHVYEGDPAKYFYAVAKNILLEDRRKVSLVELPPDIVQPAAAQTEEINLYQGCFERCLMKLPAEKRQFILEYYQEDKSLKLHRRRQIAEEYGISNHLLRNRALRLRKNLQKCVLTCASQNKNETFSSQNS